MQIKDLINSNLYDENEQVVVVFSRNSNINDLCRIFTGRLSEIPTKLHEKKIESLSAMGESRRNAWNLNKYGWTEIWIEEGE